MKYSKVIIIIFSLLLLHCTRRGDTLTSETPRGLDDFQLEMAIIDNIQSRMNSQMSDEREVVENLSKSQQAIYVVWILEAEVNNGGFNQFYYNTSGELADFAESAFTTIGAPKFAELVKKANAIYDSTKSDLEKYNDGTIEGFSKSYENNPLNDLDSIFYALDKEEPLHVIKMKYIKSNLQEFTNQ